MTPNKPVSPFNPNTQLSNVSSRIVASLERIAEAFRVVGWRAAKEHKLSPIQVQIVIFLYYHSADKGKVNYLAEEFNMTKQTISDAVLTLEAKGYVKKITDLADARSSTLHLTQSGTALASQLSNFAAPIEQAIMQLPINQQLGLLEGLLSTIYTLNQEHIISVQRMCSTCKFYTRQQQGHEHYCRLLELPLADDLTASPEAAPRRLDCQEHQPAQ